MVGTADNNMVVDNRNNLDLLVHFQELILQEMELQSQSRTPDGRSQSRTPDGRSQNQDGRNQNLDGRNQNLDDQSLQSLQNHRMVFLCH